MPGYIPNTSKQQQEMLAKIGLDSMDALFDPIPQSLRLRRNLDLPAALSELELFQHMKQLAGQNYSTNDCVCFLGAGAYDHFIPSVVGHMVGRSEFATAYTPYQPEISQGTLQAIFEYQTLICELTGMDVSNASMYDGASALTEAAGMACASTNRQEVLIAKTVHPESRIVLKTAARFKGVQVREIGHSDGQVARAELDELLTDNTAAVIVQNPNFFGTVESLTGLADQVHSHKALLIISVDPISLGLLKSPGELGADIAVGEGQSLGNPLSFGGPYLGFLACKKILLRRMPGRICGETTDTKGRRGFVLTMQTREQHIRREKATSNICSNQALNALAATVYLSALGKQGLKEVATLCLQKSHYTYERLLSTKQFTPAFSAPFFKEFVLRSRKPVDHLNRKLLQQGILGGYSLKSHYPELPDGWLLAVTEKRTKKEIDQLVGKVAAGDGE